MDSRSQILASALRLFAARGYDAVGTQEIVDDAGLTKPTLYHYFGSKQGLLDALLAAHYDDLLERVASAADYHHDLPGTLNRVAAAYFAYAAEHPEFYRMQLSMWFAPRHSVSYQSMARLAGRQQALLEALFLAAADDHGNMRGRHEAYAATFLGMINTYIGLALNDLATINDHLVYRAVHQFMHGIFS